MLVSASWLRLPVLIVCSFDCSEARTLFNLADTDESGDIDEDELVWLIQELWKELGVRLKVSVSRP